MSQQKQLVSPRFFLFALSGNSSHPFPGVMARVELQQHRCVFPQHSCLFSRLGQLVPAHVQMFEALQISQAFKSK